MSEMTYLPDRTAILLLDPYNDFMTPGGKLYEAIKAVADASDTFANMKRILRAARAAGMRVFVLPHHRARPDDYKGWQHLNPTQVQTHKAQMFAADSWGGEFNTEYGPVSGDIIIREHWHSSGFANTDLDEQLKQHHVANLVCIGMLANSCVESTARYGMELGYHVTLVRDATAAFSAEAMHHSHDVNAPMFAHEVLMTSVLLDRFPALAAAA